MARLFIELTCEEIPARMQAGAIADLNRLVSAALAETGLPAHASRTAISPRHMALELDGVDTHQPDISEERRGPRVDAPEKAVQGFCASVGQSIDMLEMRDTPKGQFYFAKIERKGQALSDLLPAMMQMIIAQFPWPKSQRWGRSRLTWVRPLHGVNVLIDGVPVAGSIDLGGGEVITFGAQTHGHPFISPGPVSFTDMDSYKSAMEDAYVQVCADERRAAIEKQAADITAALKLQAVADAGLLNEVVGLVEWPNVIMGRIDDAFMSLPAEVLITSMRVHQKYFAVEQGNGQIAPYFLTVANRLSTPASDQLIAAGNERVLRARLADAAFFWDQDRKDTLASKCAGLDAVTFYEGLGSVGDKTQRMAKLGALIAPHITGCDTTAGGRAIALAKADLVSGMVGEFPELQGIMGGYYAAHDGEDEKVAAAIRDHYRPAGPADKLPKTPEGLLVSLTDKIDTLVGFFGVGAKPTGSRDPFALRRAALAVLRIMDEADINLPLDEILKAAAEIHGFEAVDSDLQSFITDRLKGRLRDAGLSHDTVAAAISDGVVSALYFDIQKAHALDKVLATETGDKLMAGYRRAANILAAEIKKQPDLAFDTPQIQLCIEAEERALLSAVNILPDAALTSAEGLDDVMRALASLQAPIDAFFEKVIVNAEDQAVRMNRLSLLADIQARMHYVADFSQIEKS
ncbi:MAG: glycine--tRNA ligase subunit beta [Candidatus Puniceispirillaceae bacterium]